MTKILALAAVIFLFCTPFVFAAKSEYTVAVPYPQLVPIYEAELDAYVRGPLAKCESGNNEKAIHKDDGGSDSIGYVQYKVATWLGYIKKYRLDYTLDDIWKKEAQIEVTKLIIKNEKYGYKNWYNCTSNPATPNFAGMPPQP